MFRDINVDLHSINPLVLFSIIRDYPAHLWAIRTSLQVHGIMNRFRLYIITRLAVLQLLRPIILAILNSL
jgi:hypothetical protein